jgi:hypothetical protein
MVPKRGVDDATQAANTDQPGSRLLFQAARTVGVVPGGVNEDAAAVVRNLRRQEDGSRCPATKPASIASYETPVMLDATTGTLIEASSSSFSIRVASRVRSPIS